MVSKNTITAFATRAFLYISGFIVTLLLARTLASAEFGIYSFIQASLELALVVATCGCSMILSREVSHDAKDIPLGYILNTLAIGISPALMWIYLSLEARGQAVELSFFITIIFTILVQGFCILLSGYCRGAGHFSLVNSELMIKNSVIATVLATAALTNLGLNITDVLRINLFGQTIVLGIFFLCFVRLKKRVWGFVAINGRRLLALQIGLFSYAARKGDLLILGAIIDPVAFAQFKLAFLVSELPYQFLQSYFVTKTTAIKLLAREGAEHSKVELERVAIRIFLPTAFFFIVLIVAWRILWIVVPWLGDGGWAVFVATLIYFSARCVATPWEQYLNFHQQLGEARTRIAVEASVRSAILICVAASHRHGLQYAYPVIAIAEIIILSCSFKNFIKRHASSVDHG